MKKIEGDKLTREKMESLNTLSGGIVFGREEAWEKLQARMERKPVKRIPVKYWLGAAAVLLLFTGVLTVYNYPVKEGTKNKINEDRKENAKNVAIIQQEISPAIQRPEIMPAKKSPAHVDKDKKSTVSIREEDKEIAQPEIINIAPQQIPVKEPIINKEVVAMNNTVPVPPVKKVMKVVHINELENEDKQQNKPGFFVNNFASLDLRKLPVVHINDVVMEEYEVQRILKENRLSIGHLLYPNGGYSDNSNNTEEYRPAHKFQFRFN